MLLQVFLVCSSPLVHEILLNILFILFLLVTIWFISSVGLL